MVACADLGKHYSMLFFMYLIGLQLLSYIFCIFTIPNICCHVTEQCGPFEINFKKMLCFSYLQFRAGGTREKAGCIKKSIRWYLFASFSLRRVHILVRHSKDIVIL